MNIGRGKQIHMQSIVSSRLIFWKHLHFCQCCVVWLEVRYNEDLEAPFFCNLHMLEVGQQERMRSKAVNKQITEWGDVSTASCLHTGLTAHRCVRALRLGLLKWSHMIPHLIQPVAVGRTVPLTPNLSNTPTLTACCVGFDLYWLVCLLLWEDRKGSDHPELRTVTFISSRSLRFNNGLVWLLSYLLKK